MFIFRSQYIMSIYFVDDEASAEISKAEKQKELQELQQSLFM